MKTIEDKKMVKVIFFFKLFWPYIKKINTFIFWSIVIPLGPLDLHLVRSPWNFVN